ncbi:MAG: hypothetical protein OJF60_002507 [Burkholderiaceae bacterium]|jgi:hypothetical protein|nr:MAG: hypothetical protein OJF60_002507 [Burkholderiaceae bacterium]
MTSALLQSLLVYLVVACCAAYALWTLSPARLKRFVANALMARSQALRASRRLQALARDEGGCGSACSGCADRAQPSGKTPPKVRIVRRR